MEERIRSIETGHARPGMGVEQPTRHMHLENPAAQTFELELAEYQLAVGIRTGAGCHNALPLPPPMGDSSRTLARLGGGDEDTDTDTDADMNWEGGHGHGRREHRITTLTREVRCATPRESVRGRMDPDGRRGSREFEGRTSNLEPWTSRS